jgi:hypothetical protein
MTFKMVCANNWALLVRNYKTNIHAKIDHVPYNKTLIGKCGACNKKARTFDT